MAKVSNEAIFNYVMSQLKCGHLKPVVCAKSVCVDAREVRADEVGKEHIVWSHGIVEKTVTLAEGMTLITTLDDKGNPVVDSEGHLNVYDMPTKKFQSRYPKQINGHFVKDPYEKGSVMVAVKLPKEVVPEEGLTFNPPNWGGYEGTLNRGGYIMLPFDPERSLQGQIYAWEQEGAEKLDFYPNNEVETYSACDKNGTFASADLRATFGQTKPFEGYPYTKNKETL